jgi:hypothetical protein
VHVASGAATFTLVIRGRVAFLHHLSATLHTMSIIIVNLQDKRAVFSIFIALLKFSFESPSYHYTDYRKSAPLRFKDENQSAIVLRFYDLTPNATLPL